MMKHIVTEEEAGLRLDACIGAFSEELSRTRAAKLIESGSVLVGGKAEKKRYHDGQSATAKHVRAEKSIFRAKDNKRDKNPKGSVTR